MVAFGPSGGPVLQDCCHRLLADWIAATGDRFPLPDITPAHIEE